MVDGVATLVIFMSAFMASVSVWDRRNVPVGKRKRAAHR
jgi:hypothetical protein